MDYVEAYSLARKVRHEAMVAGFRSLRSSFYKTINGWAVSALGRRSGRLHVH